MADYGGIVSGGSAAAQQLLMGLANIYGTPLHPGASVAGTIASLPPVQPGSTVSGTLSGLPPVNGVSLKGGINGGGSGSGGGGSTDVWGNPSTQDSVDAWFAKAALQARNDPAYAQHLLASVNGPNGPQGSLKAHYLNLLQGVLSGNATWIAEAQHYATNPSYNGWNNAAGDGIPGDGM